MAKRRRYSRKYRKPPHLSAPTEEKKAKSMQTSWRNATDRTASLSIDEAREIIQRPPICIYCGRQVPWRELSVDHIIPKSRAGANAPSNLTWVHRVCNQQKGSLTGDEYKALIEFLDGWPLMRESVLSRLRIAGALYGRGRRRWR